MTTLVYDGSFDGFLSCVFKIYDEKINDATIEKKHQFQQQIFGTHEHVITESAKAKRVWQGLSKKLSGHGKRKLFYAFLSEVEGVENTLLDAIKHIFQSSKNVESDVAHPSILKLTQLTKSVGREKHRMEAFVRFRLTKDDIYFATIEPDFNVVPLILKHFKSRYADQKWVIYDTRRHYGIYYNLEDVDYINFDFKKTSELLKTSTEYFKDEELVYQELWKNYFKSTNIASRKNMKLHTQHVPKRYWKYLSEKQ